MSSVAMMPDSTQTEEKTSKKRTKSTATKKSKKTKRDDKKRKDNKSEEHKAEEVCSDDDSDLDLSKPLFPISSYVKNLDGMIQQMFHSISTVKLHAMLPDILKDIPLEELKKLCLEELEVMSRKRIVSILDGADPETISSSSEGESTDEETNKNDVEEGVCLADSTSQHSCEQASKSQGSNMYEEGELIDLPSGRDPGNENLSQNQEEMIEVEDKVINEPAETSGERVWKRQDDIDQIDSDECENIDDNSEDIYTNPQVEEGEIFEKEQKTNTVKVKKTEESSERPESNRVTPQTGQRAPVKTTPPRFTKTQMEILELEMRARAIKAMLKAHSKAPP